VLHVSQHVDFTYEMQLNGRTLKRTDTCLIVCSSDLLPGEAPLAIPGLCQQPDRSQRHLIPLDLELLSVGPNEPQIESRCRLPLVLLSFLAGCWCCLLAGAM
jgi:hypothetical protein